MTGGESGIRTHGTCEGTHTFQACALNHSAISPLITLRNFQISLYFQSKNIANK